MIDVMEVIAWTESVSLLLFGVGAVLYGLLGKCGSE